MENYEENIFNDNEYIFEYEIRIPLYELFSGDVTINILLFEYVGFLQYMFSCIDVVC